MRFVLIALGSIAALGVQLSFPIALSADDDCDPAYPEVCIPPPPPDLDCQDIEYRNFTVLDPDPHNFDGDDDGIGCESR
jgi:micrococcal nuclease